jgi:hypothetical protein
LSSRATRTSAAARTSWRPCAARLHLFALTSGNLSAADTAALVVRAWPAIRRAVAAHAPPALWSVTRGGDVRRLER